jgi:hypothetical protein
MANTNDENRKEKTITLNILVPADYRIWLSKQKQLSEYLSAWILFKERELNPTPPRNANGNLPAI